MIKQYITALMLASCIGGYGQEKKQATFIPPFDFPLTLSGNFGEIRSNHFHGGLDCFFVLLMRLGLKLKL